MNERTKLASPLPSEAPREPDPGLLGTAAGANQQGPPSTPINEARSLLEKITPGEWKVLGGDDLDVFDIYVDLPQAGPDAISVLFGSDWAREEDAQLVAAAPRLIRQLLGEADTLRAELDGVALRAQGEVDRLTRQIDDLRAAKEAAESSVASLQGEVDRIRTAWQGALESHKREAASLTARLQEEETQRIGREQEVNDLMGQVASLTAKLEEAETEIRIQAGQAESFAALAKERDQQVSTLTADVERLKETLADVAASGVELDDPRIDYVIVQIDRVTWSQIREAALAPAPPTPEATYGNGRCRCGHLSDRHAIGDDTDCFDCGCEAFMWDRAPIPPSTPERGDAPTEE